MDCWEVEVTQNSTSIYREVHTKDLKVPRTTAKYLNYPKVPEMSSKDLEGPPKYLKVPQSTSKNLDLHQSASKHLKVPQSTYKHL